MTIHPCLLNEWPAECGTCNWCPAADLHAMHDGLLAITAHISTW